MVLLAKLLLAPICVVAVSLAARRWGTAVGGILGGLPVIAGPILLVLCLVHGPAFGARAAAGTLLGLCALTLFVVTYGRFSTGHGPPATLLLGWLGFLAGVAVLDQIHPPPVVALAMAAGSFAVGLSLLPPPRRGSAAVGPLPRWDLPARAAASMALVLLITAVSGSLGPGLSGLLASFPIITGVLAVFTHQHGGPDQVRVLLRSFLVGFYGFATFCFLLAISLGPLAAVASFLLAAIGAVVVQAVVFALGGGIAPRAESRAVPGDPNAARAGRGDRRPAAAAPDRPGDRRDPGAWPPRSSPPF